MSFSAAPREASVSPKPTRSSWAAARVLGSNILKTSSNWTGTFVCDTGSVAPSANMCCEVPLCRSRYFSPSTDRGWIETLESIGTCPYALFSLSVSCAPACPFSSVTGLRSDTIPIR